MKTTEQQATIQQTNYLSDRVRLQAILENQTITQQILQTQKNSNQPKFTLAEKERDTNDNISFGTAAILALASITIGVLSLAGITFALPVMVPIIAIAGIVLSAFISIGTIIRKIRHAKRDYGNYIKTLPDDPDDVVIEQTQEKPQPRAHHHTPNTDDLSSDESDLKSSHSNKTPDNDPSV